jgi:hypothetical protein
MDLLPTTTFTDVPSDPDHLEKEDSKQPKRSLDLSVFNDTHFLDGAHTFQDHLFSGWFTTAHSAKVGTYLEGIRNGTFAAAWKDEVWERENPRPIARKTGTFPSGAKGKAFGMNANAG